MQLHCLDQILGRASCTAGLNSLYWMLVSLRKDVSPNLESAVVSTFHMQWICNTMSTPTFGRRARETTFSTHWQSPTGRLTPSPTYNSTRPQVREGEVVFGQSLRRRLAHSLRVGNGCGAEILQNLDARARQTRLGSHNLFILSPQTPWLRLRCCTHLRLLQRHLRPCVFLGRVL